MHSWAARRAHRHVSFKKKLTQRLSSAHGQKAFPPARNQHLGKIVSTAAHPLPIHQDCRRLQHLLLGTARLQKLVYLAITTNLQCPVDTGMCIFYYTYYLLTKNPCFSDLFAPVPQVKYEEDPHLRLGPEPDAARRQM